MPFTQSSRLLIVALCLFSSACEQDRAPQQNAPEPQVEVTFVGSQACAECHANEFADWQDSHHQRAMEVATSTSVEGDFADVHFDYFDQQTRFYRDNEGYLVDTPGPDGELASYRVAYTFGIEPLQQYLLKYDEGRYQALTTAWDNRPVQDGGQKWYHLHPDSEVDHEDVLHWTQPSATWNYMCADCHSTNLTKNYDPTTGIYNTTYSEISVGCEACHGPASAHVDSGGTSALAEMSEQINVCAQCHSRRSQLTEGFSANANFLDHYLPVLLDDGLYHPDGQIMDEVYVYGSFTQSKMHAAGVECSDCHEPHAATLKATGNGLCTQCHNEAGRADFPTLPLANFDAPSHHHHDPGSPGAECVSCHMPDKVYMGIDARRDHSFRIPRPDLTASIGVPNACSQCHQDQPISWAVQHADEWYGEPDAHFAEAIERGRAALPEAETDLVTIASDPTQAGIVRATASSLLARYQNYPSARAIQRNLKDPDPIVRIGALQGSMRWEAQERWQAVRPLLDDQLLAVRVSAVRALLTIVSQLDVDAQAALRPYLARYVDVLAHNADTAEGQSGLAAAYDAMGEMQLAEAALRRSLEINPQWIPGRVNLADLLRRTGRDHLGGAELKKALEVVPESEDVLIALALWHVRQGETDLGVPLLEKAWHLSPLVEDYTYLYMVALNSTGKAVSALAVADEFLRERANRRILELAYAIARDSGMHAKMMEYRTAH